MDGKNGASEAWSHSVMRAAGVASMLSALTTLILIFGSRFYPPPADFAVRVQLIDNPWWQLRAWTAYVHPFLCMLAALGVWRVVRSYDRGLALLGILCFGVWAYSEALQMALTNVGAAWNWFPAYDAADAAGKARIEERWTMFSGLWDGFYFLLLTAFLLANLLFGLALIRARGADRAIGFGLLLVAALALLTFFAGYEGPAWTSTIAGVFYPLFQPAFRLVTGLWLWRRAGVN